MLVHVRYTYFCCILFLCNLLLFEWIRESELINLVVIHNWSSSCIHQEPWPLIQNFERTLCVCVCVSFIDLHLIPWLTPYELKYLWYCLALFIIFILSLFPLFRIFISKDILLRETSGTLGYLMFLCVARVFYVTGASIISWV